MSRLFRIVAGWLGVTCSGLHGRCGEAFWRYWRYWRFVLDDLKLKPLNMS